MNDYKKGVYEALSWVKVRLRKCEEYEDCQLLKQQIGEYLDFLSKAVGEDFNIMVETATD